MLEGHQTRRGFLGAIAGSIAGLVMSDGSLLASVRDARPEHPDPRPDVDASRVLTADKLPEDVVELYDAVRAIPQIVDGIRCYCGCADLPGFYSLLTCYEESGMAKTCELCQHAGRTVTRLHAEGRSLDEIRAAIDRESGSIITRLGMTRRR